MMHLRGSLVWVALLGVAPPAVAVKTAAWKHQHPKDFSGGTFDQTVVSSRGELMLGRAVQVIHETKDLADVVNALVRGPDGAVYAATGGSGAICRVVRDEVEVLVKLPDKHIFSLVFDSQGMLLAGTGGEKGRIFRIDADGNYRVFHEPPDVNYVWAMVRGARGEIYAATGLEGKLFRIEADGKSGKMLYKAKPKNLLCLAADRTGMLYAGTDTDGLVLRVDPRDGRGYVLYDAEEAEISSLALDDEGNLYAATAAASAARPGRAAGEKAGGQPDKGAPPRPTTQPAATLPMSFAEMASRITGSRPPAGGSGGEGNAVYRINRDGFVSEVFREPVMILSLGEAGGKVYAATGNEGRIYEIVPADEVVTNIARVRSSQAVSLLRLDDGSMLVGTANPAAIVRVGAGFAQKGTFVSAPLDAEQIVRFGRARWRSKLPDGTRLTLATRSGNVKDPDDPAWDAWSAETDASTGAQVASPSARFLQYRLTFETKDSTRSPVLSEIEIPRVAENQPPRITTLRVGPAVKLAQDPAMMAIKAKLGPFGAQQPEGPDARQNVFAIFWKAEDPNGDDMLYNIYYRQVGRERWVRLEEDFKESLKLWDTRTVADGWYEVRLVASDRPDNPPGTDLSYARVGEAVLVDNTPPAIRVDRVQPDGKKLRVRTVVIDALSPIAAARYVVDSNDEWIALLPADDMFDAQEETLEFVVEGLEDGEHVIAIYATDVSGNAAFVSQAFTIGP